MNGDTLWTKCINTSQVLERGYSIRYTSDGGYIVGGSVWTGTTNDMLWIKTNSVGDTLWTKTLAGGYDNVISCALPITNGYILTGSVTDMFTTGYSMILIRADINGDTIWTKKFITNAISEYSGQYDKSIVQAQDGGYVIVGMTDFGSASAYLIKTDSSGFASITSISQISQEDALFNVFPNPFKENTTLYISDKIKDMPYLSYTIYDLSERVIESRLLEKGSNQQNIYNNFSKGIYFLKLSSAETVLGTFKIIIQ